MSERLTHFWEGQGSIYDDSRNGAPHIVATGKNTKIFAMFPGHELARVQMPF
jgi:hypothetical protein